MRHTLALLTFCLFIGAGTALASDTVKVSSTIGPVDAGLVPLLAQKYEELTGVKVIYEAAGTGATLEKAKSGAFDMVIVHARALEEKFIAEGYGMNRRDIFYNDFVILGPANDPAKINGLKDAVAAFKKIAASKALFITRGDMSGTHVKELEVWEKTGIKPDAEKDAWYLEYSLGKLGNGPTTLFTSKRNGHTIMDRATYLIQKKNIKIVPLVQKDDILLNFIAAIQIDPKKFPGVNAQGAKDFIDWICSEEGQKLVRDFQVDKYGEALFFPNSAEWHAATKSE